MPKRALTAAAVGRIKPPETGQADHYDRGFPGLALRVSYGGAKAWTFFYRLHGRLCRTTLGRYPAMTLAEARDAWRNARVLVAKGESPVHHRPAGADSFGAIAEQWLKRDQADNRSVDEVKRVLDHDVLPVWRDRLIATIARRDIIELLDAISDRGAPIMARRTHAHLHRLFRWAVGRGIIDLNPMSDLPKVGTETRRDRVLTDAELRKVWNAADDMEYPFGPAIKLLILTGARRNEIGALSWSEVHDGAIELAGSRTKNGEAHTIPLSPAARDIIANLPRIGVQAHHLFTTTGKAPVSGWSKAKTVIDASTRVADWRLHDLRRTVATRMQRLGVGLQVIEECLGHISGSRSGIVGVYQRHAFEDEKRAALEAWAREVERIVMG